MRRVHGPENVFREFRDCRGLSPPVSKFVRSRGRVSDPDGLARETQGYTGSGPRGSTSSLKYSVLMPDVWNGGYNLVGRGFRSPSPCVVFVVLVAGVCVRVCCDFFVSSLLSPYSPFIVVRGAEWKGRKGKMV